MSCVKSRTILTTRSNVTNTKVYKGDNTDPGMGFKRKKDYTQKEEFVEEIGLITDSKVLICFFNKKIKKTSS